MQEYYSNFDIFFYSKVYQNVVKMMKSRDSFPENYKSEREYILYVLKLLSMDLDPLIFLDHLINVFLNDENKKIMVYYNILGNKLGKKDIEHIVKKMQKLNCNSFIVINKLPITKSSIDIVNLFKGSQIFLDKELSFNLIEHALVPKHTLLEEEEIKKLLESYSITQNKLPGIYITDPVCKYYNACLNDVFRIERRDSIYYRTVIKYEN